MQPETVILPGAAWLDPDSGFGRLPEFAAEAGLIRAQERRAWEIEAERGRSRGFFAAFTAFRVVGRRP